MFDGQADLDAELVGLARLALGDALNFGRMQRVGVVLVVGLLRVDAPGAPKPQPYIADGLAVGSRRCP